MSLETRLQEAHRVIADQNQIIVKLCKEKNALQAKIDQLMLEFCPEEMTQEQIENWKECQTVVPNNNKITFQSLKKDFEIIIEKQKHMKTIPMSNDVIGNTHSFVPEHMFVVCPDCGNKRCPKATNPVFKCTNSNEVGQVGEVEEDLSVKQCCEGGLQWGHAWDCPKCPD